MKTLRIKNKRKINSGKIWEDYFTSKIEDVLITKNAKFTGERYEDRHDSFYSKSTGKNYAILSIEHYNAHISGWQNKSAIYSLVVAEIYEK